jgi:hypothetical protein
MFANEKKPNELVVAVRATPLASVMETVAFRSPRPVHQISYSPSAAKLTGLSSQKVQKSREKNSNLRMFRFVDPEFKKVSIVALLGKKSFFRSTRRKKHRRSDQKKTKT